MKSARVLTTLNCTRDCSYCANKGLPKMQKVSLETLKEYGTICLTGGEPLLEPRKILHICKELQDKRLFLYTQHRSHILPDILPYLHGITFTMHDTSEIALHNLRKIEEQLRGSWCQTRLTLMPKAADFCDYNH